MRPRAFVYILRCADGTLYTGYTIDLNRRLKQHQGGNGGRYTHTRTPVQLVYYEPHRTRRRAMQREVAIKSLPRAKKLVLIAETPLDLPSLLSTLLKAQPKTRLKRKASRKSRRRKGENARRNL